MTIKEKMHIRKSRIQEYKYLARMCRKVQSKLIDMEENMTKYLKDRYQIFGEKPACIVTYHTYVGAEETFEGRDIIGFSRDVCEHFDEMPCSVEECPHRREHEQYAKQKDALNQAKIDKADAFKSIFQRIK